jgi:uncharacterized protein YegL
MKPFLNRNFQIGLGFGILAAAIAISYFSVTIGDAPKSSDVVLIIDTSGSMNTEGKLDIAKIAANQFVDKLLNNNQNNFRVGLVSFSDQPHVLSNLTNDASSLKNEISQLGADGGTAMGDAISESTGLLQNAESENSKIILLLTDGQSNEGSDPSSQAKISEQNKITIFTVGYGADADSVTLSYISGMTGGKYFAASSQNDLINSFNSVANMIVSPVAHYGSRTLILVAIPILLFIPVIEKGVLTMVEKFEATMIKRKPTTASSCPSCKKQNLSKAKFCASCGTRLQV